MVVDDHSQQRVRFLLSLSMTCMTMRFRLLPWIWERIECVGGSPGKLNTVVETLRGDVSLATSVKYFYAVPSPWVGLIRVLRRFMTVSGPWGDSTLPKLFKCLESLPNLHTLEMGEMGYYPPGRFRSLLEHVELPQVKALILADYAYPLLRNCRNVEDVVYVAKHGVAPSEEFCEPLVSNQDSKVKHLTVPLISWSNLSRK